MTTWDKLYRSLETGGTLEDDATQRAGSAWLEDFQNPLGDSEGRALDLGCGLGADMKRLASWGWQVEGLDAEPRAVTYVKGLGFAARRHDLRESLPFEADSFELVVSRCALHFLDAESARRCFQEIHRVLVPSGRLLFVVNSLEHRRRELQYDYRGAVEVEPCYWHLPSLDRTYLFYTPILATTLLGRGWQIRHLQEGSFTQWGIDKRVVTCLAVKQRNTPVI